MILRFYYLEGTRYYQNILPCVRWKHGNVHYTPVEIDDLYSVAEMTLYTVREIEALYTVVEIGELYTPVKLDDLYTVTEIGPLYAVNNLEE
jgi:hypothetical protein